MRALGLEPRTYDLKGRCSKNITICKQKTYNEPKNSFTEKNTHPEWILNDDIARLAELWDTLPTGGKQSIMILAENMKKDNK